MTPMKMIAFVDELTKTAKPRGLGTMLGQNVTKTVKAKAKGLAKKAGPRMAALKALAGKASKKMSAGYTSVGKTVRKHPRKSMAAGAGVAFVAGRSSKRK